RNCLRDSPPPGAIGRGCCAQPGQASALLTLGWRHSPLNPTPCDTISRGVPMLSVMIPALNEEQYLEPTVLNVVDSARRCGIPQFEIIVVNDGSTDGTAEVIRRLEERYPFVRSIQHVRNQGIGQSFIDALAIAKYGRITFFSGDNNAHRSTIDAL